MAPDTLACDEHVGGETLSAWRDTLLPEDEMRRIAVHAATCPACRTRLAAFDDVARALHRQVELLPDERILLGVRERIAGRRRPRWRRLRPLPRVWSGLGALGSVAALLLLFIYVLNVVPTPRLPRSAVTATAVRDATALLTATSAAQVTATAAASAMTPAFSPTVGAKVAWGTPPDARTVSTRIDATHVFTADGIMPDGNTLLGDLLTVNGDGSFDQTSPAVAGMFNAVTRKFTSIGVTSKAEVYMPGCCVSDGRFVVAADYTEPGATCGACHIRYWSYDTQTGTLRQVAIGSQFENIYGARLSNGFLVFWTLEGIQVANLVTHTIAPLPGAPVSASEPVLAFSWPYLIYALDQSNATITRIHDMRTGQERTISEPGISWSNMAIAGDTLFAADTASDDSMTTIYQMDNFPSGGGAWHAVATMAGAVGAPGLANDRIVAFGVVVWDRAERRFVSLETSPSSGGMIGFSGNYLAAGGSATGGAVGDLGGGQVIIYDTATLPVNTGT